MKTLRLTTLLSSALAFAASVACSSSSYGPTPNASATQPSEPATLGMQGNLDVLPTAPDNLSPENMPPNSMPLAPVVSGTTPDSSEGGTQPVGLDNTPTPMPPMGGADTPSMGMAPETPPAEPPPAEDEPAEDDELEPEAPAVPPCEVVPVPAQLRQTYDLDPFYTRVALARGVPVLSSDAPVDQALIRACELLVDMLSLRQDVVEVLIRRRTLFSVIGEDELTNDIPEYRNLPDTINQRARGLGGEANGTCAEESILCNRQRDRWRGEGICVHEYAHTLSAAGLFRADPTFQGRLRAAYQDTLATGRFANTYALESLQEYWAEGVQDWYNTNLESTPPNGVHNEIDKRSELQEYDPVLYGLIAEFLPANNKFQDCYADVPLPE